MNDTAALIEAVARAPRIIVPLERFVADRARLVARVSELSPEEWSRTATHPECSTYSVFIMSRHAALHDFLHGYRIEELLLAPRGDA